MQKSAKKDQGSNLKNENEWNATGELCMSRLMAEQVHSGQRADAAAQYGNHDKDSFGNAPCMSLCTGLVCPHRKETYEVQRNQVVHKIRYQSYHLLFCVL